MLELHWSPVLYLHCGATTTRASQIKPNYPTHIPMSLSHIITRHALSRTSVSSKALPSRLLTASVLIHASTPSSNLLTRISTAPNHQAHHFYCKPRHGCSCKHSLPWPNLHPGSVRQRDIQITKMSSAFLGSALLRGVSVT